MNILKKVGKYLMVCVCLGLLFLGMSIPISVYEYPNDLIQPPKNQSLIIDNINVIDVNNGSVKTNQTLVIEDGYISNISNVEVINSDWFKYNQIKTVIDGTSKFITPGLIDMHVHVHDRKYLSAYLSMGITTVRNMRGLPMHLRWREEIDQHSWLGSKLVTSSPVLAGEKYAHALQQVVTNPEQSRRLVKEYANKGYDLIKIYSYLDEKTFKAIKDEALKLNIPATKHGLEPPGSLNLESLEGLQSIEHVENIVQEILEYKLDETLADKWVKDYTNRISVPITPTLTPFDHLTKLSNERTEFVNSLYLESLNPLYKFINEEFEVNRWLNVSEKHGKFNKHTLDFLLRITNKLHKNGAKLLVGSDSGVMYIQPGFGTHREIALLKTAGLSEADIIKAATLNAAEALGKKSELGSIEEGKIADLLILDQNPLKHLDTLAKPTYVITDGRIIDKILLKELQVSSKSPSNWYVSLGRLLEDLVTRVFE